MPSFRKALQKTSVVVCVLLLSSAFAQNTKAAEAPAPPSIQERDHVQEREEWFRSGRKARGETAADLLHRAYNEKLRMRAAREAAQKEAASAQREGRRASPEISATPNFSNIV